METFVVKSGMLRISDPCYKNLDHCSHSVAAKKGNWKTKIKMSNFDSGYVESLQVRHEYHVKSEIKWEKLGEMCVDSGQAGIFDEQHYRDDSVVSGLERNRGEDLVPEEPWYSFCCDRTLSGHYGTIPFGAVSSSGYGDGGYPVYVHYVNGEVVAVKIRFI